jgi:hypothetical protein
MTDLSPLDAVTTQTSLRQLAEQLSLEYAGAIAPGRVFRLVLTTGHRLYRRGHAHEDLLRVTKATVRANLTTLIGASLAAGRVLDSHHLVTT